MATRSRKSPGIAPGVPRGVNIATTGSEIMLVDEPDGSTTVWVNGVPSSAMREEKDVLDFEYMRHEAAAIAAWNPPERMLALHVGAGVCTLPRFLAHRYPDSRHIAVDVDPELPSLARQWWDLPQAPRLRIRIQDGAECLVTRHDDSADLIVRDAFSGDTTPPALTTAQWWAQTRRVLRPGGLVIANVGTRPGHTAHRDDVRAAWNEWGSVVAIGEPAVLKGRRRGNVVLAAGATIDGDALKRYAASAPLPTGVSTTWQG
ncbi:fused MFS/spermidine synthase [Demequina sp. B12]|uniref:spermidine synthase n=1 Tax=Demequina sp. B12 TaxID=2992757 RepID=UPI00237A0FCE|nr:fused MFS/spermidine synthase [Demequina sp. B12]MDE0573342.1 fused MFS/spermidine synthase [Demequina sp. B12]